MDLGYEGALFTWSNKRYKGRLIQERLDRFVCSKQWKDKFAFILVLHITMGGSNHLLIRVEFCQRKTSLRSTSNTWGTRFQFEDYWSSYEECKQIVEKFLGNANTSDGSLILVYLEKLGKMREEMREWSSKKFGKRR